MEWNSRMRLAAGLIAASAALSGCSAIIRSKIDTQPRVHVDQSDLQSPAAIVKGQPIAYMMSSHDQGDPDLIAYAPIIMQGFQPDPEHTTYDYWSDGIGMPRCTANGQSIHVDPTDPAVFARVEHATVHGKSLKQLTYSYWYPRRDVGSIETGDVDGGILRITLDAAGNPAIFEFSQSCGCYHGVFASSRAESQAQQEFGTAPEPRSHALETLADASEWIIRDVVPAEPGQQPVLYISAGEHFCELLRFVDRGTALHEAHQRLYTLKPYEQLNAIPLDGGGTISMFNKKGLVRGAKRWKEELVFSDINHPGWPRHLDVMLVHWDHDRWGDPELLEHNLRVPHAMADGPVQAGTADR